MVHIKIFNRIIALVLFATAWLCKGLGVAFRLPLPSAIVILADFFNIVVKTTDYVGKKDQAIGLRLWQNFRLLAYKK